MQIGDLMTESGVSFGTSGARGLVTAMTDRVCYAYTAGFLSYLRASGQLTAGQDVGLAGDLRPSSPRILTACAAAVHHLGYQPRNYGAIPSPALAAFGIAQRIPTLMITGSHIPDDRNGIKFNLPTGEILKADEDGIRQQIVTLPPEHFDAAGQLIHDQRQHLPMPNGRAYRNYVERYLAFFPPNCLAGLRIGVYEHSSVARKAFAAVLTGLGAQVTRLGYSSQFLPVDTEAIRSEDVVLARNWAASGQFDALVSADGDGDRPLISDELGNWLRGDMLGILCARQLGARGVVTPISSNTAVEKCGAFATVIRTRIGSPFVIAGMNQLLQEGIAPVVGYEANGGFLLGTDLMRDDRRLAALPTRDAVIVAVTVLLTAVEQNKPISALAADLPQRFTHSDRLKNIPTERSQARLAALNCGDLQQNQTAIARQFGTQFGAAVAIDTTDGLRITFANGEIVHLRPSGNAPELRVYTEADSAARAAEINRICLEAMT
ncbi:phosphomannomutase [Chromatium weissei]|nr:phosphomannomutase [Chromatium weissei]